MQGNQLVVFCSCPDHECAVRLGTSIVKERLAACINLVPGLTSIYMWQDELKREPECLMLIKTNTDRFEALRQRLRELHPYDLPEIIALPVCAGDPDYVAWLTDNTRP